MTNLESSFLMTFTINCGQVVNRLWACWFSLETSSIPSEKLQEMLNRAIWKANTNIRNAKRLCFLNAFFNKSIVAQIVWHVAPKPKILHFMINQAPIAITIYSNVLTSIIFKKVQTNALNLTKQWAFLSEKMSWSL